MFCVRRISIFGIHQAVPATLPSGLLILKTSLRFRTSAVDRCVVVGALADLSAGEVQAWRNMGAMGGQRFAPEQACRPFDQDRDGFIYGQGCGAMVLEHPESAHQRGVDALAILTGSAAVLDGNRLSDPNVAGEVRAMEALFAKLLRRPASRDSRANHNGIKIRRH